MDFIALQKNRYDFVDGGADFRQNRSAGLAKEIQPKHFYPLFFSQKKPVKSHRLRAAIRKIDYCRLFCWLLDWRTDSGGCKPALIITTSSLVKVPAASFKLTTD